MDINTNVDTGMDTNTDTGVVATSAEDTTPGAPCKEPLAATASSPTPLAESLVVGGEDLLKDVDSPEAVLARIEKLYKTPPRNDMAFCMLDLVADQHLQAILDCLPTDQTPVVPEQPHIQARPPLHTTLLAHVPLVPATAVGFVMSLETRRTLTGLLLSTWLPPSVCAISLPVTGVEAWDPPATYKGPPYKCIVLKLTYPDELLQRLATFRQKVGCYTHFGINPHATLTYVVPSLAAELTQHIEQTLLARDVTLKPIGLRLSVRNLAEDWNVRHVW